ncbi:MAG: molybdopterin-binding protein [Deltaproteobacteria bacterium]|nr:molybdopterin-binding protein [Deltaproteobacteria bacterium]
MSEVRKIPLEEAVGLPLAHDLTEVNPEEKRKGRAFKRGQIIQAADLEKLRQLGKDEIYILDLGPDQIHEDEAALLMARAFAGRYIGYEPEPREGKINFYAQKDGLLLVDTAKLQAVNLLAKPSCITKPRHRPVRQGEMVAATRIIPLYCERQLITKAAAIAAPAGLFSLLPFKPAAAGVIVTGNEVYQGKVKDGFLPVITRKLAAYQAAVHRHAVLPDDLAAIRQAIGEFIAAGCDLVVLTGGTSVDPNDLTPLAIREAGGRDFIHGVPLQPGNMFTMAWIGGADGREIPVCAVPAAALFYPVTSFDVFLPRLLTGQRPSREEIAAMGHGGLCNFCRTCVYPVCSFGRS